MSHVLTAPHERISPSTFRSFSANHLVRLDREDHHGRAGTKDTKTQPFHSTSQKWRLLADTILPNDESGGEEGRA